MVLAGLLFAPGFSRTSVKTNFKNGDGFNISGTVKGIQTGNVVLSYVNGNKVTEVAGSIKNEKFSVTGHFPETQQVNLSYSNSIFSGSVNFFAGNEKINVIIDTALLSSISVTGSASQKEYEEYAQLVSAVERKSDELNSVGKELYLSGKLTESIKDSLFNTHDEYDKEKRKLIAAFAKDHPESAVSAWAISTFFGFDPQLDELEPAYNSLSEDNQASLYGKQIREIIESAKKTAVGKLAIDFKAADLNGNPVSISSYKGKYVLVDFWASWCGPCRGENPNLVRLYNKYHSEKFDIIGFSLDNNKDAWGKAVKNDKLSWTQLSDLKAWDSRVVQAYGIKGIPFNILLDQQGRIMGKNLRGVALQKKVEEIFN